MGAPTNFSKFLVRQLEHSIVTSKSRGLWWKMFSHRIWPFRNNTADFQIMSDLHLEVGHQYSSFYIPKTAPYLILAGDIGRLSDYESYLEFLSLQCRKFIRVFLVLGNHEFYGLTREEGLRRAKLLEQEPNLCGTLVILNRTRATVDAHQGIIILGCTLLSRILPGAREIVSEKVKDFKRIKNWTVAEHLAEHIRDVDWLQNEIRDIRRNEENTKHRIIVISHYPPCIRESSSPADAKNPWSSAFGTDLLGTSDASALSDVQMWIFGHTHFCTEFWKCSVKLISNQRGYYIPKNSKESFLHHIPLRFIIWGKNMLTGQRDSPFQVKKTIKV